MSPPGGWFSATPSVAGLMLATSHSTDASSVPESTFGMSATKIKNFALSGTFPQLTGGATLPNCAPWRSGSSPTAVASGKVKSIVPADLTTDGGRVGPGVLSSRPDVEHPPRRKGKNSPCAMKDERPSGEG